MQATPLTQDQLEAYLARIGQDRPRRIDLESLTALHRAHLLSFTWEALDAFMRWPQGFGPEAAFAKMVTGRRGGWCYEMNGLFGAALSALGFRVTRLCGGVNREVLGDLAIGNHLTLRVDLDRPYLAEVGVADAIIAPVPMEPGPICQRGFDFAIGAADQGWMRFRNHALGVARSFDFRPDHSDETALAAAQGWLLQDAGSPFTGALAIMRHTEDGYVALQNDSLRHVTAGSLDQHQITGADHLADILHTTFQIDVPRPDAIWDRIEALRQSRAA